MSKIVIEGGYPLTGEIKIGGAKNSAVALIPAAILCDEKVTISNVPNISDIDSLETYFSNDELLQSGVVSVASEIFGCEELSELLNLNNVVLQVFQ